MISCLTFTSKLHRCFHLSFLPYDQRMIETFNHLKNMSGHHNCQLWNMWIVVTGSKGQPVIGVPLWDPHMRSSLSRWITISCLMKARFLAQTNFNSCVRGRVMIYFTNTTSLAILGFPWLLLWRLWIWWDFREWGRWRGSTCRQWNTWARWRTTLAHIGLEIKLLQVPHHRKTNISNLSHLSQKYLPLLFRTPRYVETSGCTRLDALPTRFLPPCSIKMLHVQFLEERSTRVSQLADL